MNKITQITLNLMALGFGLLSLSLITFSVTELAVKIPCFVVGVINLMLNGWLWREFFYQQKLNKKLSWQEEILARAKEFGYEDRAETEEKK